MRRLATRLALVLLSTLLALAVARPIYRRAAASRRPVVEFRRPDAAEAEAALARAGFLPADQGDGSRPGVLEVESARFPASAFRREALAPEEVARWYPGDPTRSYDPFAHYRSRAGLANEFPWREHPRGAWTYRTNSLGMREDREPRSEPPDLRILVTGDSHTDGVCDNAESFVHVLERELAARHPGRSVEALNAGCGGYSFYQYLGTLERFLPLEPDAFVVAIYGGNDFEEVLALHHRFQGTARPDGSKAYWSQVERALEVFPPSLAQCFGSLKYFAANPGEREVALQAARDVCTEIAVVCLRHAVRPVFVYVPPLADVEWQRHAGRLERVRDALELSEQDLQAHEGMADSLLASLRERRLEVVDLRPAFRAHGATLFWEEDHHVNLDAQRLVARELVALFDAELAAPRPRARRAPGHALDPEDRARLLAPGAPGPRLVALAGAPLPKPFALHPLGGDRAREALAPGPEDERDEHAVYRYRANLDVERSRDGARWRLRTDALGLREVAGVAPIAPATAAAIEPAAAVAIEPAAAAAPAVAAWRGGRPRVLVLGGAHVDGPWPDGERLPALLAAALAEVGPGVGVLDASHERYSFHNYEGAWRSRRALAPDVLVLAVDGADDLASAADLAGWLPEPLVEEGAVARLRARLAGLEGAAPRALARELAEIELFRLFEREQRSSLRHAIGATLAIDASLREAGGRLIVVWFPPAGAIAAAAAERIAAEGAALGWSGGEPRTLAALGERYVLELGRRGVEVVDAGALPDAAYDPGHLLADLATRRAVARELAHRIAGGGAR